MDQLASFYGRSEPIAVIGMACRLPGVETIDDFWNVLIEGRSVSRPFSQDELDRARVPRTLRANSGFVAAGAMLENCEKFDAALFGYSRTEAETIDPQQRLFLQAAWHALEDAGYPPLSVPHKTGVFGSSRMSTYGSVEAFSFGNVAQVRGMQALIGNDKDYLCSRVAYKLGLTGPALTVQTACSSSLVAVHMACESLRAGECDMALAGGVGLSFPQSAGYLHQAGMIFSPDAKCRPFAADANGTFAGQGLGLVVLRRLEDALRDGDLILAVLRGSAVNNDGDRKVGFTAPSAQGQADVVREALILADVSATDVTLIEAHGTGTPLGDPIEIQALHSLYPAKGDHRCAIGSLKGNYGHLDTAAGIVGLMKAIVAVNRGMIPPSINCDVPNPALNLQDGPFYVPTKPEAWHAAIRTAGVSSFGIGGTNCHMIVQSPTPTSPSDVMAAPSGEAATLLLSAASRTSLRSLAAAYASACDAHDPGLLARNALVGRQLDLPCRLAVPVTAEIQPALAAFAAGQDDILVHHGSDKRRKLAWLFTGQGGQWAGMGRDMAVHSPPFAQMLHRCERACIGKLQRPLREVMFDDAAALDRPEYAQPSITAFEVAMAAHWRSLGLEPDVVVGHSWGEVAAAIVAGAYTVEDGMALAVESARLLDRCPTGGLIAVFATIEAIEELRSAHAMEVAAINADSHIVLAGRTEDIAAFAQALSAQGIRNRPVASVCAAHSSIIEPALPEFSRYCAGLTSTPLGVAMISTLDGTLWEPGSLLRGDYWPRQMRQPADYRRALTRLSHTGGTINLELGPSAVLCDMGEREAPDAFRWIASHRREAAVADVLQDAYTRLFAGGVDLSWQDILEGPSRRIPLPLYAFDSQSYWYDTVERDYEAADTVESTALTEGRRAAEAALADLDLDRMDAFYRCVTDLHNIYVDRMVQDSLGQALDHPRSASEILQAGRLLPRYAQLLDRLLDACVEDGYYRRSGDAYRLARPVPHHRLTALIDELRNYCEGHDVIADTVVRAGEQLSAIMRGDIDAVSVIFPAGQSHGVEVLYEDFSFGRYFNRIAAGVMTDLQRDHGGTSTIGGKLRILEVGGGTGGTTSALLPTLAGQPNLEYHFTDISPLFTRRARAKFADYPFLSCREMNLQAPAAEQGFVPNSYDIIVAANVIHATQHIGETLANLRGLLKPGGKLLMREITRNARLFDFVFGGLVLPLHDLEARQGQLFLSTDGWREHCRRAGFDRVEWLPDDSPASRRMYEHVILASLPDQVEQIVSLVEPASMDDIVMFDWSEYAGKDDKLVERLHEASRAIAIMHNQAAPRSQGLHGGLEAPAWLKQVRATWYAGLFGRSEILFEMQDPEGVWHPLARISADAKKINAGHPFPKAARDTHYRPVWRSPHRAEAARAPGLRLSDLPLTLCAELKADGIVDEPERRLIVLPEGAGTLDLARTVMTALGDADRPDLLFVTSRAWSPTGADDVVPAHRAIWGLLRVAATEQPARRIAVVDLEPDRPAGAIAEALEAMDAGHCWLAMRDGMVFELDWGIAVGQSPRLPLKALDSPRWHVVTGGFGGLGRATLGWLVDAGARRIAVLAPRAPQDVAQLQRHLEDAGLVELRWIECDCADAPQLAASLSRLKAEGGIEGAIHAAGILDDAPLDLLDSERLGRVFAVKAASADILRDALAAAEARYLLLYSSAAASLGPTGQAAHALASGYLDGVAEAAKGPLAVMSIAWGAWSNMGRAAEAGILDQLAEKGMGALDPAEGLWHLDQAMSDGAPFRLAMRGDLARLLATRPLATPRNENDRPVAAAGEASPTANPVRWLTGQIIEQLQLDGDADVDIEQDLLQLGLDSLMFLDLRAAIEDAYGVGIDANAAYDEMTIQSLAQLIDKASPDADILTPAIAPEHDAANRYAPFPLTPIQHAYWLGRTDLISYGGVACHIVFEWDKRVGDLDPSRLEDAWNLVIKRHDMLRMVVEPDGHQRILETVEHYRFEVRDLRGADPAERQRHLASFRSAMEERVLPTHEWPLFEIAITWLEGDQYRLHMNLDLLQFDTQSLKVMMDDWAAAYRGSTPASLAFTFRDYVMLDEQRRESREWKDSWCYWQDLLADMPPAPLLPMREPVPGGRPGYVACQHMIDARRWTALKADWKQRGVTPSAALLTLFGRTLARWARQPAFTLNLTYFNRRDYHPDVSRLIGDFTSVLPISCDQIHGESLFEAVQRTQRRLWGHFNHAQVSGVEVLRERGRLYGMGGRALMPVVFTSMLGMTMDGESVEDALGSFLGDPIHAFTQTPQVWLDHQIMEQRGALVLNWFCMEDVFVDDLHLAMFEDYKAVVDMLARDPAILDRPGHELAEALPSTDDGVEQLWRRQLGGDAGWKIAAETLLRDDASVSTALSDEAGVAKDISIAISGSDSSIDEGEIEALPGERELPMPAPETLDAIERSWTFLEARAGQGIVDTLVRHGLFVESNTRVTLNGVMRRLPAQQKYRRLVRQWLDYLCDLNLLRRDGDGYSAPSPLSASAITVPSEPVEPWNRVLADYLDTSITHHDALLRGDASPLDLLFDSDGDVTEALYSDHPTMAALNAAAAVLTRHLSDRGDHPLDILELGAGTGATTRKVLPAVFGSHGSYTFSDISPLFLQDARRRFGERDSLKYMLLDINQALDMAAHPDEGYDLIIASNVLHDAVHVGRVLRRIRRLLKRGGRIMMIEATTRRSAMQMASVGFIEGLSAYQDRRSLDDKVMLDAPMWRSVLENAGYRVERQWPDSDDSPLRQHLLVARAVRQGKLDLTGLRRLVIDSCGTPSRAFTLREVEQIASIHPPLDNPETGPAPLPAAPSMDRLAPSATLSADVTALWEELLERPVTQGSDFFQSGGDSLIATRLIARMTRMGYANASLQSLFANPVLDAFCRTLAPPAPIGGKDTDEELLVLKQGDYRQVTYVLPASDGETAAYLPLVSQLEGNIFGLRMPDLSDVTTLDELASQFARAIHRHRLDGVCHLMGWSYGAHLAAATADALRRLGRRSTLVLLDPISRADVIGGEATGATVASALPPSSGHHGAYPERVHKLLGYLTSARPPCLSDSPTLWLEAADRPAAWSRPEKEWCDLARRAIHHVVPASHWEIVMSPNGAGHAATIIDDWWQGLEKAS